MKVPHLWGTFANGMGHNRQELKIQVFFSELHIFLLKINKTKNWLKASIYLKQYFICIPQNIENKNIINSWKKNPVNVIDFKMCFYRNISRYVLVNNTDPWNRIEIEFYLTLNCLRSIYQYVNISILRRNCPSYNVAIVPQEQPFTLNYIFLHF